MSRSIHTTHRQLILEWKTQIADDEIKEAHISRIQDQLDTKRSIKKTENLLRRQEKETFKALGPVDPQGISINFVEASDYIHYLVTKDDLIEVARRLPVNAFVGIDSITLGLGKEYQEEEYDGFGEKSYDPYTGRICAGDGPIYYPPIMGIYRPRNNKIFLFAYVYDKQIVNLDIVKPFLRLRMLKTFIHEVAHHDDNQRRVGSGHYFGLNEDRCENYADAQEISWAETTIVPYLKETYPEEYDRLLVWIKQMGGVDISLNQLIGEYHGRIGNLQRLGFSIVAAVEEMIINAIKGMANREIKLEFARDLHVGDFYLECMKVLETVLSDNSRDSDALGIKADTLVHLERNDEAEITAKECLKIDPANIDALLTLCEIQRERKNWRLLEQISAKGIEVAGGGENTLFIEKHLIASLHLKDYRTAGVNADALPSKKGMLEQKKLAFTALVALVSGDIEKSVQIATEMLSQEKVVVSAKAVLKAILNKYNGDNGLDFTEYEENFLRWYSIKELM